MGTSYDGVYFFGCISEGDVGEGWSEDTMEAFEALGVEDFDNWVDAFLGVGNYRDYPDYSDYKEERERRMTERWGCVMDGGGWLGYIEYATFCVYPKEARLCEYGGGRVPDWPQEQIEEWRSCMERLRKDLPGLSEPGLWFGCKVG